jgi:hypothetical protein
MLQQKKKKKTEQPVFTANNAKITNIEKKKKPRGESTFYFQSIKLFLSSLKKEKKRKGQEVRERT